MTPGATAVAGKIVCDGCGQGTSPEHIARRLRRLELATRYRPIHIQAVFLNAQSPVHEQDFLYAADGDFRGEAAALLSALKIETVGRDREAVLADFQRKGFFLTHVLECAPEGVLDQASLSEALKQRLPSVIRRLRGSLRPKRIVLLSAALEPILDDLKRAECGGELVLDGEKPFALNDNGSVSRLTSALGGL